MANATATELQQLYIAYFGRAGDPSGLDYWTSAGTTTTAFAANMYAQNEFNAVYGSLSVESQVNQIYQNLFDRDADATGLLYWTKQINNGTLQLASIANDLIWAAQNNSGSSDDKTALTNKTNAAVAYTAKVKESAAGILAYAPTSTDPWVAGANIDAAKTYFQGIDKDSAHTTAGIASSVATIVSNGAQEGKYTLTSNSPSLSEGDSGTKTLAFTISLDRAATEATTFNYETLTTGTASSGDDFVAGAGTVSFAAGQKTATVNVTTNGDTTAESDETVKIKFTGSQLAADVTATGTISNNDTSAETFTLSSGTPTVTEGDTGSKSLSFNLTLDSAPTSDVTVSYETLTSGSATAGDDFTSTSGTTTFKAGSKVATVDVAILGDTDVESGETVKIKFSGSQITADVTATGTITNDDTAATTETFTLTSSAPTITEGDTGTKNLSFNLTLDSAPTSDVTVSYETLTSGSATAGDDFTASSGTVTFASGSKVATVNVSVLGDTTYENSGTAETVKIKFSGTQLTADVTATGSITENETNPDNDVKSLTLTTGLDNLSGANAADSFDATIANSLNNGDTLTGGTGVDVLTTNLSTTVTVNSTSVETFNITSTGTATLNMAAATDVSTITNTGSGVNDLVLNNLTSVPTVNLNTTTGSTTLNFGNSAISSSTDDLLVNVDGTAAGADIVLSYAAGATNTVETVSINSGSVSNVLTTLVVPTGTTTLEITGDQQLTFAAAFDADFTTISAGDFTGALSGELGTGGDTITTGSGADSITAAAGDDVITSGAGNDVITVTSGGVDSITLGAGDDSISAANLIGATDTVAGGAGSDTLAFASSVDVVSTGFTLTSGFDVIEIADNTANDGTSVTITNAVVDQSDSDSLTLTSLDSTAEAITLTATGIAAGQTLIIADSAAVFTLATGGSRVTLGADGSDANTVSSAVTLGNGSDIVTGSSSSDVITVVSNAGTAADTLTLGAGDDTVLAANLISADETITGGAGTDTLETATAAAVTMADTNWGGATGFEAVTIGDDSDGNDGTASFTDAWVSLQTDKTITVSQAATDTSVVTAGLAATNTLILADSGVAWTLDGDDTRVTIGADGSDAGTTSTTVNLDGSHNAIVTGSSSADTVVLASDADSANTISLGAGDDTISAAELLESGDTITGGAGSDTLLFSDDQNLVIATAANTSGFDVISLVDATTSNTYSIVVNDALVGGSDSDSMTLIAAAGATGYTADVITLDANLAAANTFTITDFAGTHSVTLANNGNRVTIGADGDDADATNTTVTLGTGDDIVTGSSGADSLVIVSDAATANKDTVTLGAGDDSVSGAQLIASDDTITGGAGTDTLVTADAANVATTDTDWDGVTGFEAVTLGDDTTGHNGTATFTDAWISLQTNQTITATQVAGDTTVVSANLSSGNTLILGDLGVAYTLSDDTDNRVTIGEDAAGTSGATTGLTLGADSDIVTGSSSEDTVTAVSNGTGETDNVNLGAGADVFDAVNLSGTSDTIAGGAGADTLKVATGSFDATSYTNITGFETIEMTGDVTLTLTDTIVNNQGGTVTINEDGSDHTVTVTAAVSSGVTVNLGEATAYVLADGVNNRVTIADETSLGASETVTLGTGDDIVTGSGGSDTIVLGGGDANLSLGLAADTVQSTDANLTGNHTIDGGGGTDILDMTNAATLTDNDFRNISSVETFQAEAAANTTVTLEDKASATGITTVTFSGGDDVLTTTSEFTQNLTVVGGTGTSTITHNGTGTLDLTGGTGIDTVNLGVANATVVGGGGADIIDFSSGTVSYTGSAAAIDTVKVGGTELTSADTISGVDDTSINVITTTANATFTDASFTNVTAFASLTADTGHTITATLGSLAATATLDSITGSTGADSVDASGFGAAITIIGGAGADTIVGSNTSHVDSITPGVGNDHITVTENSGANAADLIYGGTVAGNTANGVDTIVGFETTSDVIHLENTDTTLASGGDNAETGAVVNVAGSLVGSGTASIKALYNATVTDFTELLGFNQDNCDLSTTFTGSEILKGFAQTGSTAASLTFGSTNGDKHFFVAYDAGNAYVFHADSGNDMVALAAAITPMFEIQGIATGGIAIGANNANDFNLA